MNQETDVNIYMYNFQCSLCLEKILSVQSFLPAKVSRRVSILYGIKTYPTHGSAYHVETVTVQVIICLVQKDAWKHG